MEKRFDLIGLEPISYVPKTYIIPIYTINRIKTIKNGLKAISTSILHSLNYA